MMPYTVWYRMTDTNKMDSYNCEYYSTAVAQSNQLMRNKNIDWVFIRDVVTLTLDSNMKRFEGLWWRQIPIG
jgi:hypothetical protein